MPGHSSFTYSAYHILGHYTVSDDALGTWGDHCDGKGRVTDWRGNRHAWSQEIIEQGGIKCPRILCAPGCKSNIPYSRVFPLPPPSFPLGLGLRGLHLHLHPPLTTPLLRQGYSFVAPSILFDHNNAVMTDVLEASIAGDRPGRAALARSAMMQVGWARVGRSGLGDSRRGFSRRMLWFGELRSLSEQGRGMAARLPVGPLTRPLRPQDSPFFQQYELDLREPALGQGSFSVCRRCRQLQNGQEFAVKILSRRWAGPGWAGFC